MPKTGGTKKVKNEKKYDVIIAGAGPAGSICALTCARQGLRTLLVEADADNKFGHTCALELEADVFGKVGVPEPQGGEIAFREKEIKVISPSGKPAFTVPSDDMYMVKLEETVRRFVGYAKEEGVDTLFGAPVTDSLVEGDKVVGIRVNKGGKTLELKGSMVVDATGHAAAITRLLPPECGIDFSDRPTDRVLAEARLYEIDVKAAQKAIDDGKVHENIFHHRIAVQGTYSTLSYYLSVEKKTGFILVGLKDDQTPPLPSDVIAGIEKDLGFFKKPIHRGAYPIRIRRASLRLVCDGFAVIGEAAGMVIPMHASGVASSMLAGHSLGVYLGRLLRDGGKPTTKNLWPWAADYQRGRGWVLATYDGGRRLMETMDPQKEAELLVSSGIMQAEDMHRTLLCKHLGVSPSTLPARLKGIVRHPLVTAKFAVGVPKIAAITFHWGRFPQTWDPDKFAVWKKTAEKLLP